MTVKSDPKQIPKMFERNRRVGSKTSKASPGCHRKFVSGREAA